MNNINILRSHYTDHIFDRWSPELMKNGIGMHTYYWYVFCKDDGYIEIHRPWTAVVRPVLVTTDVNHTLLFLYSGGYYKKKL